MTPAIVQAATLLSEAQPEMRSHVEVLAPATLAETSCTAAVVARAEAMAGLVGGCRVFDEGVQRLAADMMTGGICAGGGEGEGDVGWVVMGESRKVMPGLHRQRSRPVDAS